MIVLILLIIKLKGYFQKLLSTKKNFFALIYKGIIISDSGFNQYIHSPVLEY